jgi:hypothetical protein
MSDMDSYEARYERDLRNNDVIERSKKRKEAEEALLSGDTKKIKRPDLIDSLLTEDQALDLREKYSLICMTCEEELSLIQDLRNMGILTNDDCEKYIISGGNIISSLKKKIGEDINLLYKIAISGRDDTLHIEHIRSQQKLLDVLEQLMEL